MITSLERFHDFVIISHKAFFKQNNLRHRPDILGREEFRDSDNHVNACKECCEDEEFKESTILFVGIWLQSQGWKIHVGKTAKTMKTTNRY